MADTGIFATHAEILRKAGLGVNTIFSAGDATADAHLNDFISQAESYINVLTGVNYSDTYSTLNVDKRGILKEASSNLAAIYITQFDTDGYSSLREAENIINANWARFVQIISLLKSKNETDFITAA